MGPRDEAKVGREARRYPGPLILDRPILRIIATFSAYPDRTVTNGSNGHLSAARIALLRKALRCPCAE